MLFSAPPPALKSPCQPSPCGSNAQCTPSGNHAVCTCLEGYRGNPYIQCRPECIVSSDCPLTLACINQKCRDPCPGTCGSNALCTVVSHNPKCLCPQGYIGDAYTVCHLRPSVIRKLHHHFLCTFRFSPSCFCQYTAAPGFSMSCEFLCCFVALPDLPW